MGESEGACILSCCCTFLVSVAIIVFMSLNSVDAQQVGLDYSYITKSLDKTIYKPGFHFLGFGHSFIIYPTSMQSVEFSNERTADRPPISSRTDDGLGINFKVTYGYVLLEKGLYDLYMKYGEDYKTPCENFAVDVLNDQATKNDASRFFFE